MAGGVLIALDLAWMAAWTRFDLSAGLPLLDAGAKTVFEHADALHTSVVITQTTIGILYLAHPFLFAATGVLFRDGRRAYRQAGNVGMDVGRRMYRRVYRAGRYVFRRPG